MLLKIRASSPRDKELGQELSEKANYQGVRSFMGWSQVPGFDISSSFLDDNPFVGSRSQPASKVSVKLPAVEWLYKKLEKLNITITEGYPSKNSETAGLLKDQFVKTPRSSKW